MTLNLPDPQLYDELEITLPGHIRRLERAGMWLRLNPFTHTDHFSLIKNNDWNSLIKLLGVEGVLVFGI